jgi:hypothetical protein
VDKKHPNEPKPVTPSEPPPVQAKHGDILIDGVKIEYDRQAPAPATEKVSSVSKDENEGLKSALEEAGAEVELK